MESQQEKLLSELNSVTQKLDTLFHYIDEENKLSEYKSMLLLLDLTQIGFTLDKIHNKLR